LKARKLSTKDNVSIDVSAVAYYQVIDPVKAVVEIQNVGLSHLPDRPNYGA